MRTDRRKRDRLLIACATLGLVSAIATGALVTPVLLDTSSRTDDTETDVSEIQRLAGENDQRIEDIGRLTRENQQAVDALCALRADLRRRARSSRQFLEEHPRGIPGVPAATIRSGIRNQERTIRALRHLSC